MTRSNGLFFEVLDLPPLEDTGFEIRVLSFADFEKLCRQGHSTGPPLAVISKFVDVTISPEISGVGAGSITLNLDDDLWKQTLTNNEPATSLLEHEHVWQVFENGLERFAFLGQTVTEEFANTQQTRVVTVSGKGVADVLRWARVMTPHYPNPSPVTFTNEAGTFQFRDMSVMSGYLTLLQAAQKRGTIAFVCPSFDADRDSAGQIWFDKPPPHPPATWTTTILNATVNFFPDSATLSWAAAGTIAGICAWFKDLPSPQITIVGHTDSTNTVAYNQSLSVRRANAVAALIRSKVPQAVIHASGRGELQPIQSNRTVWGREQNRRVVVTYPKGTAPVPLPYYSPPLGINLLDLLNELTGTQASQTLNPLRMEWIMRPNFVLDVRKEFGQHREHEVVFYEGSFNTVTKSRERTRNDIANLVAVQNDLGYYTVLTDQTSIARWRQRENYSRVSPEFNDEGRQNMAQVLLEQSRYEHASWTIKVSPYAPGRVVFQDYNLGDWIGVSRFLGGVPNQVEPFRVMALTMKVTNTNVDLELTLQSRTDVYARRLQARLSTLENHWKKSEVFVQDVEPPNAKSGDIWTPSSSY